MRIADVKIKKRRLTLPIRLVISRLALLGLAFDGLAARGFFIEEVLL